MLFDHQLPPNPLLVVVATFLVVVLYVGVGVVSVILREDVVIIPCVEEDRVVDFTGGIKGGKVGSVG